MFLNQHFLLDDLAKGGGLMVLCCTIVVSLLSQSEKRRSFIAFLLMGALGSFIMCSSDHLILSFVGLVFLFLSGSIMIKLDVREAPEVALKHFILGHLSIAFFLMGIAFIYGVSQILVISRLAESAPAWMGSEPLFITGILFIIVGSSFFLTIFPFHFWAPDVYRNISTPMMGFLLTISKMGVVVFLARIFLTYPLFGNQSFVFILQLLSILTAFLGSIMVFKQEDLKGVLTYFSIAHSGYILLILVALGVSFFPGVLLGVFFFYLFIDSVINLSLLAFHKIVEKNQNDLILLQDLNGLNRNKRFLAIGLSIVLLSLSGLPPVSGFFSRVFLIESLLEENFVLWVIWGVLISATIGSVYCLKVLARLFSKNPPLSILQANRVKGPILVLILFSIVLSFGGFLSKTFVSLF